MNASGDRRIVVFAGPSIPPSRRNVDVRIEWLPPAKAGDAHSLRASKPGAVVLIDGLFDDVPAIRHKELLLLIAEGVHVYGAASMGALRAAELHRFGMIGVGHIFLAYHRGLIDADDEVAVLHGPESFDWQPLTEPLVNIRATLIKSVRRRVIGASDARTILLAAKAIFYKQRTWSEIFRSPSVAAALGPQRASEFLAWLPEGYIDLKRLDAMAGVATALRHEGLEWVDYPAPPETVFSMHLAAQVDANHRQ